MGYTHLRRIFLASPPHGYIAHEKCICGSHPLAEFTPLKDTLHAHVFFTPSCQFLYGKLLNSAYPPRPEAPPPRFDNSFWMSPCFPCQRPGYPAQALRAIEAEIRRSGASRPVEGGSSDVVVDLGCGTGKFTREILLFARSEGTFWIATPLNYPPPCAPRYAFQERRSFWAVAAGDTTSFSCWCSFLSLIVL